MPFVNFLISASSTIQILDKIGITAKSLTWIFVLIFALLLPYLASMSSRFIGLHTKAEEEITCMRITFVFLLFMAIIMPVLGFNFGADLLGFLFESVESGLEKDERWNCFCKILSI